VPLLHRLLLLGLWLLSDNSAAGDLHFVTAVLPLLGFRRSGRRRAARLSLL